jgi:hypothetical protein
MGLSSLLEYGTASPLISDFAGRFRRPFLRFRVSRPGDFKQLRTGDASPLPVPGPDRRNIRGQRELGHTVLETRYRLL